MSDLKLVSPLLDDYDTGGSISEHHGVNCYPAMRKDSTDRYIVKQVSIPASPTQLEALLLTGAYSTSDSALSYFKSQADGMVEELEVLQRLAELEGYLSYDSWQVDPKENSAGYDVTMIGPYKYSLRKYLQHQPATQLSAVNLGLDLCAALSVCRQLGYLYVDLKPNNIFVNDNSFRIGDIGFLKLDNLKYATLAEKYCSAYTAPEALDALSTLTPTLDTYALGLILYQIYNGGDLPTFAADDNAEQLPSPAYADYEMSEIILKACSPNPEMRWQDPVEMAQALVSYMQRNGVNDTPIVPPTIHFDDIPIGEYEPENSDSLPEDTDSTEAVDDALDLSGIDLDNIPEIMPTENTGKAADAPYNEDDFGNLSFLDTLITDETAPENNIGDVGYDEISDELSQILNQADELVSHTIPDSNITIDEPVITLESEEEEADTEQNTFLDAEEADIDTPETAIDDYSMDETIVVQPVSEDESEENFDNAEVQDDTETDELPESGDVVMEKSKKKQVLTWVLTAVIFILIAAIAALGLFYYRTIYLLPINGISVDGNESNMVVFVETDIDEEMLSVICSDSHGNQISAPVINGTATFANLTPDTAYNVRILVDGFHRLTGDTAASYSTPAQTNVAQFSAVTGSESGSVILSFTVEGPDTGNWKLSYSAPGEDEVTVDVLSHMVTVTDLIVGKEYTFTLIPGEEMYVIGNTQILHTASDLVSAENVNIVSCVNNQMTVIWDTPADTEVASWTVRCYNDAEYNQTAITSENFIVFDDVDPNANYTVEVIAAGMSISERAFMSANAVTISNFVADVATANEINLTWDSSLPVPADGWVLLYSVDGSDAYGSVACNSNSAKITPVIPDAEYTFKLQHADGSPVLSDVLSCQTPITQDFSGYGMTRSSMSYQLCRRPDDDSWSWNEVSDSSYTTKFTLGDKIGLIGKLDGQYGQSDDEIAVLFVIRDLSGNLVTYSSETQTWNDMWNKSYAEISVPQIPSEAGDYTITMYFNGKFVSQKAFTLSE